MTIITSPLCVRMHNKMSWFRREGITCVCFGCYPYYKNYYTIANCSHAEIDTRHIQYQGETLPFSLVLAFHLVLGKFHI